MTTKATTANSKVTIRRAAERGHADHGWLDSYHSFSFAEYYDPAWMGFRDLRVINDDLVLPKQGFGTHGHRDMEIITYVLSGAVEHRDSLGNGRVIRKGDLQYMAAGSGVHHSELNPSDKEAAHFLQIWIEPDTRGVAPRYEEKALREATSGTLHLVASKTGRNGSISINQDADLWLARLEKGQKVSHELASGRHAWLHVAEGDVTVNGETLSGGDAAAVEGPITIKVASTGQAQVLLFDLN